MSRVIALVERLAPDSIALLERAARQRIADAEDLNRNGRRLPAIYFLGFAVEMLLAAAYFRSVGFGITKPIDRQTRSSRMVFARKQIAWDGEPLMSGDPHPLVGWARLLEWNVLKSGECSAPLRNRLSEAIRIAESVYRHWRPELRYKNPDASEEQYAEVLRAADWFLLVSKEL